MSLRVMKNDGSVHEAIIVAGRIIPWCRPRSTDIWHRMPGHQGVTCRRCKALRYNLRHPTDRRADGMLLADRKRREAGS